MRFTFYVAITSVTFKQNLLMQTSRKQRRLFENTISTSRQDKSIYLVAHDASVTLGTLFIAFDRICQTNCLRRCRSRMIGRLQKDFFVDLQLAYIFTICF